MIERVSFYLALNLYLAALLTMVLAMRWEGLRKTVRYCLVPALLAQTVLIVVRWFNVGHPPMFGTFENVLATTWFLLIIIQVSLWRKEISIPVGITGLGICIALITYGLRFDTAKIPVTISERSLFVDIHAFSAMSGFAFFAIAFALIIRQAYLRVRGRGEGDELLDDLIIKNMLNGYGLFTIALAFGAYYAFLLYGKWWKWDPVETLSLIGWLLYGLAIHLRLFYGWKRLKSGWLMVLGFLVMIVAFWAIMFFPDSYHIFDLPFVKHI